ncbi:phosphatase domain-containing protein [Rubritalea marina]|uniref:phosphatase domain-containing protein n=1 Tax=Rubritalea marina TaxID=361055 RepID=UPI000374634A|nr:phosphatase domain-containing protein [Rubritalea marina]
MIWLRHGALVVEWLMGVIFYVLTFWIPRRKAEPVANVFNAVHHPKGIYLFGRVMALRVMSAPKPEDGNWENFKRMASNWFTLDFPNARVEVKVGQRLITVRSNKEGYFELHDTMEADVDRIEVSLPQHGYSASVDLTDSRSAPHYVVICDVDDTVVETGSISMMKMLETTLFGNLHTREIVPAVPELVSELHRHLACPVFYVTSSPWNLARFLKQVFRRAQLPLGGLFMTNWGLTPEQWLTPSHDDHKRESINEVARWYDDTPFILIGDDSQRDPEIYSKALRDFGPDRVKAILIRNVAGTLRGMEVKQDFELLNESYGKRAVHVEDEELMRQFLCDIGVSLTD